MRLPQVRRRVDASVAERKTDAHSALGLIPKPLLGSGLADRDDGDTCPTPARIDIWRGHRATLEPVVPGVREYLTRVVIEFDASGPLGDRMRPTRSTYLAPVVPHTQLDGDGVIRPDAQVLSQGLVPGVRVWLEELGYRQNALGISLLFVAASGMPAEVTQVLVPAIEKVVKDPALAAKHLAMGWVTEYAGPEKVAAEMRDELRMVEEIVRQRGMVPSR